MIGHKLILIKNVVVVACQTKELCSCQLPSTPTLNQVVITTTTTKILPCLPCVLPNPTVCTPCTKVRSFYRGKQSTCAQIEHI